VTLKIVVVSDTHGNIDMLDKVIYDCSPFDIIVHCGDGVRDICAADIPGNSAVLKVLGNTDLYSGCDADDILTEQILDRTIMVTHGHQFNVKTGFKQLEHEAENFKAGIVLFGHTHEQFIRKGKPLLFNPGNLSGGNYGIIHASRDDEWMFEHRKIKK
jgi:hypothetical protein